MTRVLRCTRIKRRILRPTSLNGASAPTVGQWVPGTPRYGRVGSFILAAFLAAAAAFGAEAQKQPQQANQPPAWRGIFPKPPDEVARALKITRGQPFEDGYVFINGKYEPPPYTVERYGNVIRINGIQVTREIVSWAEIAKTQKGFAVRRAGDEPEAAPQTEEETAPEEEKESETASAAEEQPRPRPQQRRDRLSLEELFGEKPVESRHETAPKPAAQPQQPKKPRAAARKPQRPAADVVTFEGEFIPDETTAAHVAKMNDMRTKIDSKLRAGGYIFFGSRYPLTVGNATTAKYMVGKLPEIMRRNTSRDAFVSDMHRAGLSYLPPKVMDDLFRNRFDFLNLLERAKKQSGRDKWREILDTPR